MATVTEEKVKIALARMVYYADFIKKDGFVDTRGFMEAMQRVGESEPVGAMDDYESYMLRADYIRPAGGGTFVVTESGRRASGM